MAATAALILLPAFTDRAALLVYEGFNYPAGVANLPGKSAGSGWNGPWTNVGGSAANLVSGNLLPGTNALAGYESQSEGNSTTQPNTSRSGRWIDTSPGGLLSTLGFIDQQGRVGADGKTLYLSFLQQSDGATKFYEFELHRGNLGDPGRIAGIGNDLDFTTVNFRAPNGTQTPIGPGNTNVNFYVVRIDFKSGADDVRIYRNPRQLLENKNEPTLTLIQGGDLSFDGISFGAYLNGRMVRHDEIRIGTSWSDVVGGFPAFATEPSNTQVVAGESLTLTAQAEGQLPLSYQWFRNDTSLPRETNSNLLLASLPVEETGNYRVVASNIVGCATSRVAQVTLEPLRVSLAISNQTLALNESLILSANVEGAMPLSVQWLKNGEPVAEATNATLAISHSQLSDAGDYALVVNNAFGAITSAVSHVYAVSNVVLAYEGFNYAAGSGNLPGQNGGSGWSGAWTLVGGSGADVISTNLLAGENAPVGFDIRSLSRAVFQPSMSRSGRGLDCSSTSSFGKRGFVDADGRIGADGKTLYVSFLQRPDGAKKFYEFEFHRGNLGDPGRIAGIGNDLNSTTVNFRAPNGTQTPIAEGTTNTSFYVLRIDFKTGADDVTFYQNPTGEIEAENSAALFIPAAGDMSFDGISLAAYDNNRTVMHDEIRVGATWQDVMGVPVSQLEIAGPATNGWRVQLGGTPGFNFYLQNATNISGPWSDLANLNASSSGAVEFIETNTTARQSFYRTLAEPQLIAADNAELIADFESDTYGDWIVSGTAFGSGPASGTLPNQLAVSGYFGNRLVNSFVGGDSSTGKLTSPLFRIVAPYLEFLIGGGNHPGQTCINLWVNGSLVRTATGFDSETLVPVQWNVSEFLGENAFVEIVDNATGSWGHINVDHITQTEIALPALTRELVMTNDFLNLPIRNGAPQRRMSLSVDGKIVREFDIELADHQPDWWAFLDLKPFAGKTGTLEVNALSANSEGLDSIFQSNGIAGAENLYQESLRPQFHFSSRRGWLNDANGLVYYAGEFHLFYQHNPYGWNWGNMHWGHAVSSDLVRWKELPIGIYPHAYGDMVYSGSAVMDWANTSGFKTGTNEVMVAAYTSTARGECIAFSNDRGRTFTDYEGNPVVAHSGRDPRLFWFAPSNHWVMVVYDESPNQPHGMAFYSSTNLRDWTYRSRIPGLFECPDLFALPVDGETINQKWILNDASGGYLIGQFDGSTFTPETQKLNGNSGNAFYASQTYSEMPAGDSRRVQISWGQISTPGMPFNQMMLFPTELTLRTTSNGIKLCAEPVREIANLHDNEYAWSNLNLSPGENPFWGIRGDLFELRAEFDPGNSAQVNFAFRGVPVTYNSGAQQISCNGMTASLPIKNGVVQLQILVDRTSIEIFGNDGELYMPMRASYADTNVLSVTTQGGTAHFNSLQVYKLKSAWLQP